jgi:hypothetical protein
MDFAGGLIKVHGDSARSKEEKETFFKARSSFLDSSIALAKGDATKAVDMLAQAISANPADKNLIKTAENMSMYIYWAKKGQSSSTMSTQEKQLYSEAATRAGYAMVASITGDHEHATQELQAALEALSTHDLVPNVDPTSKKQILTSNDAHIFDMMSRGILNASMKEEELSKQNEH